MTHVDSDYCHVCGGTRRFEQQGINHVLHLLLSVLTCGVWLLVWGYQGFKERLWRCTTCGTPL